MADYPADDLDRPRTLTALLGSFWSGTYGGATEITDLVAALASGLRASTGQLDLAVDCLAYDTIPPVATRPWAPAVVRVEDLANPGIPLAFGTPGVDYDPAAWSYGAVVEAAFPQAATGSPTLVGAALVADGIAQPGHVLVEGLDFTIRQGVIAFAVNPADDPSWPRRARTDANGVVLGEDLILWLARPRYDADLPYRHAGFVVGLDTADPVRDQALAAALLDAAVTGSPARAVLAILAALCGVPLARGDETVTVVDTDQRGGFVATDRQVYRLPAGANAVVAVGDRLEVGDAVCDALVVGELGRGFAASGLAGVLPALALGAGVLGPGYRAALVVEDQDYPLTIQHGASGRIEARFPVRGLPPDVDRFWDEVEARCAARGQSFAEALARGSGGLPATANPLRLIVDEALQGAATIVVARVAQAMPAWSLLRRHIPPTTLVLLIGALPPAQCAASHNGGDTAVRLLPSNTAILDTGTAGQPPDFAGPLRSR